MTTDDRRPLYDEIEKRKDETVQRLREWIALPSIAAENRGMNEGCDMMMRLARDAGFQSVEKMPTDGHPGVFATLDAGARRTMGLYFMYDVKQVDPKEWSSPPFAAALVDKPGLGRAVVGRGAVNQKGPQAAFLAALVAFRASKRRLPVNLVLVAEGEEEIGSPHFGQIVRAPKVQAALGKTSGVFMPDASQDEDGNVGITLGAKGLVEAEIVASGEAWGRGPTHDVHSSLRACVDSPAWRLILALRALVDERSEPSVEGFGAEAKPLAPAELAMVDDVARRTQERTMKAALGVSTWARGDDWRQSIVDLCSRPTINIEGLVGGYTGPGGKTILPHRAVAKIDMRLVPDMTAEGTLAKLRAHLAKKGFADVAVNMSGGYDPTTTAADAPLVRAMVALYKRAGIDPVVYPRGGGSWPGYLFTGPPLSLAAVDFGLGHGDGAHAPDEYFLIDSTHPKVQGITGAVRSFVDLLYDLG